MDFNPSTNAEVQGLHAALGAIFVLLPVAICLRHPAFGLGYPRIMGSFIGVIFAAVKEFSWDEDLEDVETRGSNLQDFSFYILGILIANALLWI